MKIVNIKKNETTKRIFFCGIEIYKRKTIDFITKYYILGIKIFQKYNTGEVLLKEVEILREELNLTKTFLTYCNDIKNLPKAQGILRTFQLTSLKLMTKIDEICKINNIDYFILYGTLLGAVRHKGFVPWDDDLDIIILRKDFDKFIKILDEKFSNSNISYYYWSNTYYNVLKVILKIPNTLYEYCPFVDVHIYDSFNADIDAAKYNKIKNFIMNIHNNLKLIPIIDITEQQQDIKTNISLINDYANKYFIDNNLIDNSSQNKYFFMGAEFPLPNLICLHEKDIYPLVRLPFEDKNFNAPNNYEKFLYKNYGDYMKPHIDGNMYHFNSYKFTYEQIKYMQNFVNEKERF